MATTPPSRRERNKQEKRDRITRAARQLFAEKGVAEVTTQEVSERADVATGTLFLYARSKGELLLMAHNASYEEALERGAAAAREANDAADAVRAIVSEIVACNRAHLDNGRAYLREMVFGDPAEPHHAAALDLSRRTEVAIAARLVDQGGLDPDEAATRARVVSAVMLLAMASPLGAAAAADEVVEDVLRQLRPLLP